MDSHEEINGIWWQPENIENKVSGTLHLSETRNSYIELEFTETPFADSWTSDQIELIVGRSKFGELFTIEDSQRYQINGLRNVIVYFIPSRIYRGYNFNKLEEIKFSQINLTFEGFNLWINQEPINVTRDNKILKVESENVEYKNDFKEYFLSLNTTTREIGGNFLDKFSIQKYSSIDIASNENRDYDFYFDIIKSLKNFFTLATSYPIEFTDIYGTLVSKEDHPSHVQIIDNTIAHYPISEPPFYFRMLFSFNDIKDTFQEKFSSWRNIEKMLYPVMSLFFSVLTNPHNSTETVFIHLTQIIETYHRKKFGGKYQSDDEYLQGLYKNFVEAIPDTIGKDFRSSLQKGKLRYANEYSLRKRLQDLLFFLLDNNISINATKKIIKYSIPDVVSYRNTITHPNPGDKNILIEQEKLIKFTSYLRTIIELLLLIDLGFTSDQINTLINKNNEIRKRTNFVTHFW